jgi:hypothetical protein
MALYMAAKRLGVKISAWRMSQLGQFLPRHLTERTAALPHKAAAPTVRHRGSCGPIATLRTAEKQPAVSITTQSACSNPTTVLGKKLPGPQATPFYTQLTNRPT